MALSETCARVGPLAVETAAIAFDHTTCGDRFCLAGTSAGVIVAVADGLGHGEEAAEASAKACAVVEETGDGSSLTALMERCHEQLRRTRGAVMTTARFRRGVDKMEWIAVGNVEGLLVRGTRGARTREAIVQRPGILGHGLPALRSSTVDIAVDDTLILATDGIDRAFGHAVGAGNASPGDGAATLLRRYATGDDDALLLIARYVGDDR